MVNERDIYDKQEKKYNIITIQPKEHEETIKKYPIYRLEDQDQNYYRKLQIQDYYSRKFDNRHKQNNPESPAINQAKPDSQEKPNTYRPNQLWRVLILLLIITPFLINNKSQNN